MLIELVGVWGKQGGSLKLHFFPVGWGKESASGELIRTSLCRKAKYYFGTEKPEDSSVFCHGGSEGVCICCLDVAHRELLRIAGREIWKKLAQP